MIFNTTTPALLGIGRADLFFKNLVILNALLPLACIVGVNWGIDGVSLAWFLAYPPLFWLAQRRSLQCLNVTASDLIDRVRATLSIGFAMLIVVFALDTLFISERITEPLSTGLLVVAGVGVYVLGSLKWNKNTLEDARALIFRK